MVSLMTHVFTPFTVVPDQDLAGAPWRKTLGESCETLQFVSGMVQKDDKWESRSKRAVHPAPHFGTVAI